MAHKNPRFYLANNSLIKKIAAFFIVGVQLFSLFLISFPTGAAPEKAEKATIFKGQDFLTPPPLTDAAPNREEKEATEEKIGKVFSGLAPQMQSSGLTGAAKNQSQALLDGAVSQQLETWLTQHGGQANVSVEAGLGNTAWNYRFDTFYPWLESENTTLFSQMSARRWNARNIVNFGAGYRKNMTQNLMLGGNLFLDMDATRNHHRIGAGFEVWSERLRTSLNYYHPLSGWKKSADDLFNDDTHRFQLYERAAKGWDLNLETQLGRHASAQAKIFRWYGDKVDVLGTRNEASRDPFGLTLGVNWQPISLLGLNVNHSHISNQKGEWNAGMQVSWDFGRNFAQQIDPMQARALSSLIHSRHEFVTRNHNIVLSYQQKDKTQRIYFDPASAAVKALGAGYVNAVKGGNGGYIAYASSNPLLADVDTESGMVKPLRRGNVQISAYEYPLSASQVPLGSARYNLEILPADVAPGARHVRITGEINVGGVLHGEYTYLNNEGADEHPEGSDVSWYRSSDMTTPIGHFSDYTLTRDSLDDGLVFRVIPVNADGLRGEAVQADVKAPVVRLQALTLTPVNGIFQQENNFKFKRGTAGIVEAKVRVLDSHGDPVSERKVFWHEKSAELGVLSQSASMTDSQGYTSVLYNNIQKEGTATLRASLDMLARGRTALSDRQGERQLDKTFNAVFGQPKSIRFTTPPTEAVVGAGKALFSAKITDEDGQGVAGSVVWNTGTREIAESETDRHGVATYAFEIPATVGQSESWTLTARIKGTALTDNVTVKLLRKSSPPIQAPDDIVRQFSPGNPELVFAVKGGNGSALRFSSDNENTATVASRGQGGVLTLLAEGRATITLTQLATEEFTAPEPATFAVTLHAASGQALEQLPDRTVVWGDAPQKVSPKGGNGGVLSYSSSDPKRIAIEEKTGQMHWLQPGSPVTITVNEAASPNFQPQSMRFNITLLKKAADRLIAPADIAVGWQSAPQHVTVDGGNGGTLTFVSNHPDIVVANDDGTLRFGQAGEAVITVSQAETEFLQAPAAVTFNVKVTRASGRPLGRLPPLIVTLGDAPQQPTPTGGNGGKLVFGSNAPAIVSVEQQTGLLAYHAAGTALITVTEPEHDNTLTQQISYSVQVKKGKGQPLGGLPEKLRVAITDNPQSPTPTSSNGGKISYASSDQTVVGVDATQGTLSYLKVGGPVTISVLEAESANFIAQKAYYSVTVTAGPVYRLTLFADETQPVADGKERITISAIAKDVMGNPVSQQEIRWSSPHVEFGSTTSITDIHGKADVTLTSTAGGTQLVTASAGEIHSSKALVFKGVPAVRQLEIAGTLLEGSTLEARYDYVEATGKPEAVSRYVWQRWRNGHAQTVDRQTAKNYLLGKSDIGATLTVTVTPRSSEGVYGVPITSAPTPLIIGLPDVAEVVISGEQVEESLLTAHYRFIENGSGKESGSQIRWMRKVGEVSTEILHSTARTYRLTEKDINAQIWVEITPKNTAGYIGQRQKAAPTARIIGLPVARDLKIGGTGKVGETLSLTYTYLEQGGGLESGTQIKWYTLGDSQSAVGEGVSYTVKSSDMRRRLYAEVTPMSRRGIKGHRVKSASITILTTPEAGQVQIQKSELRVGERVTARYVFRANGGPAESGTTFQWMRHLKGETQPIPGATQKIYILKYEDLDAELSVAVTPRNTENIEGETERSGRVGFVKGAIATSMTLDKTRQELLVGDKGAPKTLTVTIKDKYLNPVVGETLSWNALDHAVILQGGEAKTNAHGKVTVTLMSPEKYVQREETLIVGSTSNPDLNEVAMIVFADAVPTVLSHQFVGEFKVGNRVGINVEFSDTVSRQYAAHYQWKLDGQPLHGETGQFMEINNPAYAGRTLNVDITPVNKYVADLRGETRRFTAPSAVTIELHYDVVQLRYDYAMFPALFYVYAIDVKVEDQYGRAPKERVNVCFRAKTGEDGASGVYYSATTGNNSGYASIEHKGPIAGNVNIRAIVCDKYLTTDKPFFDDGRKQVMDSSAKNVWIYWR